MSTEEELKLRLLRKTLVAFKKETLNDVGGVIAYLKRHEATHYHPDSDYLKIQRVINRRVDTLESELKDLIFNSAPSSARQISESIPAPAQTEDEGAK
ncbi:MAG: hypothetical protein KAT35_00045, partial [Candidatus Aenigmarchaeota archaeon]|nr:hypothetical protein [Candidatus Aenigmarchaeota archaeon]